MLYFDTIFLAPLILEEKTSEKVEAHVAKQPAVGLAISQPKEGLHNLLRERIAVLRGVGFGRFASHRLRRCEPTPKLRFRSLA